MTLRKDGIIIQMYSLAAGLRSMNDIARRDHYVRNTNKYGIISALLGSMITSPLASSDGITKIAVALLAACAVVGVNKYRQSTSRPLSRPKKLKTAAQAFRRAVLYPFLAGVTAMGVPAMHQYHEKLEARQIEEVCKEWPNVIVVTGPFSSVDCSQRSPLPRP